MLDIIISANDWEASVYPNTNGSVWLDVKLLVAVIRSNAVGSIIEPPGLKRATFNWKSPFPI